MVLLAVPFLIFYFIYWRNLSQQPGYRLALGSVATVLFLCSLLINISYEERFGALNFSRDGVIRRDHTATIISYGKGCKWSWHYHSHYHYKNNGSLAPGTFKGET
jgi:hypothetical protein